MLGTALPIAIVAFTTVIVIICVRETKNFLLHKDISKNLLKIKNILQQG